MDILYPLAVMLMWGVGDFILKKASLAAKEDYMLAQGLALLPAVPFVIGKPIGVYSVGLAYLLGSLAFYAALRKERVSIVAPLSIMGMGISASLFSLLLGWEKLNAAKAIAGLLSVAALYLYAPRGRGKALKEMLLVSLFWGSSYPLIKVYGNLGGLALLGGIGVAYITYSVAMKALKGSLKAKFSKEAFMGSVLTNWTLIIQKVSIEKIGIMITSLVSSLSPLVTVLLATLLAKEKLKGREKLAIGLALLSIIIFALS